MGAISEAVGFNIEQARKRKQDALTDIIRAKEAGLEFDEEQGTYVPTKVTQQQTSLKEEQLQASLDAVNSQLKEQQSRRNSDDIKLITEDITNNDWNSAKRRFNSNSVLQEKLKGKALDTYDINPLNLEFDKELLQKAGMGFENVDLTDPEIREAITSSYFKVTGANGKERLMSTSAVIGQTNQWADMSRAERDRYTKRARFINSVIKGSGITSPQERLEQQKLALEGKTTETAMIGAEQQQQEMLKFFKAGGTYNQWVQQQATKPLTYSERASKFKLEKDMEEADIQNYVNNNVEEFRAQLRTGNLGTKVAGHSLYNIAKKAQGDEKIGTERTTYLEGMVSTLDNVNRLRDTMAKADFDWDALSKGMDEVAKITGAEWRDLDSTEKQNMLDKFKFNSDLKTVMAGYIKAMSGAAVSDEERKFYEGAILGGNWSTKETALASMDGFTSGLYNGMNSALDGMIAKHPADYLNYKSRIDEVKVGLDKEIPVAKTPTKKASSFWQTAKEAIFGTPNPADY